MAYFINFIYIAMDIAKKKKLPPLSERYPTKEALRDAESRPKGPAMQHFKNLMKNKKFRFAIWAIKNDKKTFENTFGISFGETPELAQSCPIYEGFYLNVPIIDFQTIAGQTLLSFLAGYIVVVSPGSR
ncbi:MAG: hypothetical protein GY853_09975, partial [PVC group bacterium]|nr:hypothetical protein [PVC group bacterium]